MGSRVRCKVRAARDPDSSAPLSSAGEIAAAVAGLAALAPGSGAVSGAPRPGAGLFDLRNQTTGRPGISRRLLIVGSASVARSLAFVAPFGRAVPGQRVAGSARHRDQGQDADLNNQHRSPSTWAPSLAWQWQPLAEEAWRGDPAFRVSPSQVSEPLEVVAVPQSPAPWPTLQAFAPRP